MTPTEIFKHVQVFTVLLGCPDFGIFVTLSTENSFHFTLAATGRSHFVPDLEVISDDIYCL